MKNTINFNDRFQEHPLLKRPHLDHLLKTCIEKPLTLVLAGAGYGKTHAVYSFLQQYDAVVLWNQLSAGDNLVPRFWDNLVHITAAKNIVLSKSLETLGFPDSPDLFNTYIELIANHTKGNVKYVIVYDDLHLIYEKKIIKFIEKTIQAQTPQLSFVLISRQEPELYTANLRSKGLFSMVNEDNLCFSKDEVANFLKINKVSVSLQSVTNIYKETGGWIFAIFLICLSLKRTLQNEIYAISTMKHDIYKLLENEVFILLSKEMQQFLLRVSLIDLMPLDLLKNELFNIDRFSQELHYIASYMRIDTYLNDFKIHNLFLSFLRDKHHLLSEHEKFEVYSKCADWYAKNGFKTDAINLYEKIGDYENILDIIQFTPIVFNKEQSEFVLDLLNRAPAEVFDRYPIAEIFRCRFLLHMGKYQKSITGINDFINKFEKMPPSDKRDVALCEAYILLARMHVVTCINTHNYDFKDIFKMSYERFPAGSTIIKGAHAVLQPGSHACNVNDNKEFEPYLNAISQSVPFASELLDGWGYGFDDLCYAEFNFFRRYFKEAELYAHKALTKSQKKGQCCTSYSAIALLFRIYIASGKFDSIQGLFKILNAILDKYDYPYSYTFFDIASGQLYSLTGQIDKVAPWIREDFTDEHKILHMVGLENIIKARCYLFEKRYHEVLALFECQNEENGLMHFLIGKIEVLAMKAVAFLSTNQEKNALAALEEAYHLSIPNSFIMPFIELGNGMRRLVKAALKESEFSVPNEWLEEILRRSSTYAKKLSVVISKIQGNNVSKCKTLTQKEMGILTDLHHGLSRIEISYNHNISINTVKSMIETIYYKLEAYDLEDALHNAQQLNLIK